MTPPPAAGGGGGCAFCAIAAGEAPAAVVFADGRSLAFLDRRPLFHGHALLIPRAHAARLADLPPEDAGPLFGRARLLAQALPEALDAEGAFVAINDGVSQSVPHLHVHVVPRRRGDGLRGFFWPRRPYEDDAQMRETAARICAAVERLLAGGAEGTAGGDGAQRGAPERRGAARTGGVA